MDGYKLSLRSFVDFMRNLNLHYRDKKNCGGNYANSHVYWLCSSKVDPEDDEYSFEINDFMFKLQEFTHKHGLTHSNTQLLSR